MRLLLTNDDGVDAPGLAALEQAVDGRAEVWVFAPATEQSGCSHRTTTCDLIRLEPRGERRFAVHAAPADCVRVALDKLGGRVDAVLAGINAGGNLGADVFYSGTVAAVREAALHSVPGVALSHYRNRPLGSDDWTRAAKWVAPLISDLLAREWRAATLWNINLPCLDPHAAKPAAIDCPLDLSPLPLAYKQEGDGLLYSGVYHTRTRRPGCDVDVCFGGDIAVTQVRLA